MDIRPPKLVPFDLTDAELEQMAAYVARRFHFVTVCVTVAETARARGKMGQG